jgi:phosphorylase kinase alpha/beta subunit
LQRKLIVSLNAHFDWSVQNTDASLIPTISWPAFAIHEEQLVNRTIDKALRKLRGRYGLKRYFRDGFGTVVEERGAKYYLAADVKVPRSDSSV